MRFGCIRIFTATVSLYLTTVNTITFCVGGWGKGSGGESSHLQMMDILFKAFMPWGTHQKTRTAIKLYPRSKASWLCLSGSLRQNRLTPLISKWKMQSLYILPWHNTDGLRTVTGTLKYIHQIFQLLHAAVAITNNPLCIYNALDVAEPTQLLFCNSVVCLLSDPVTHYSISTCCFYPRAVKCGP